VRPPISAKAFGLAKDVETALSRGVLKSGIERKFLIFFWGNNENSGVKLGAEAFQPRRAQG
jgi:hypothetical protein